MKKWECTVCSYIHEAEKSPDECPICSADTTMFIEVMDELVATESPIPEPVSEPAPEPQSGKPVTFWARVHGFVSRRILKSHMHPIAVHTPNGIVPMAFIFLLISTLLDHPIFETTVFYSFIFVLLCMPLVLFTGYEVWQKRYHGARTSIFKIKIGASVLTTLLLLALIVWRVMRPEIMITPSTERWIFIGLSLALVATVGVAGHLGGKLVFGGRKN